MIVTGSGWCIHGVPYGPNWHCAQCGSPQPTNYSTPLILQPTITHEDVETLHRDMRRIIDLLERIAGIRR